PRGETNPHGLWRWIRDVPGRVEPLPAPSAFVLERVGPHDYVWEMENGLMSYVHRRHNPTRHALAYAISSPGEQRVAVAALRACPPKLIGWQYISGTNRIPNPLRYDLISQHLYRHYRPLIAEGAAFLEPAPPGWPGQVDLGPEFDGPLPLGRLALRWGKV